MSTQEAWALMPREQKLRLLLAQAEWLLFQVNVDGRVVDKRLTDAVVDVRHVVCGGFERDTLDRAKMESMDVLSEVGWSPNVVITKWPHPYYVANICVCLVLDAYDKTRGLFVNSIGIEKSIYYQIQARTFLSGSPVAKWINEHAEDKVIA